MKITETIINGEAYTIKTYPSGHVVKELKMTEEQKELMKTLASEEAPKSIEQRLDEIEMKIDQLLLSKEVK
jgi:hypothetical protein